MVESLPVTDPLDDEVRAALPAPGTALQVRVVEDLRVVTLRHLPGGMSAVGAVLAQHGAATVPKPGECLGADPWWVWTGPAECLLFTSHGAVADGVLQALAPGGDALACAVDVSAGGLVFDLCGCGVDELLQRLLDASAIPQRVGQGHRARWQDLGGVLLRTAPDRVLLRVERPQALHAARWIAHALVPVQAPQDPG